MNCLVIPLHHAREQPAKHTDVVPNTMIDRACNKAVPYRVPCVLHATVQQTSLCKSIACASDASAVVNIMPPCRHAIGVLRTAQGRLYKFCVMRGFCLGYCSRVPWRLGYFLFILKQHQSPQGLRAAVDTPTVCNLKLTVPCGGRFHGSILRSCMSFDKCMSCEINCPLGSCGHHVSA